MATINVGLNGIFNLDVLSIEVAVSKTSAGSYALGHSLNGDGSMPVSYVGRADYDLKVRLKQHANERKYKYFAFAYCPGVLAAYQNECELFHAFGKLDNQLHPAKPWSSCTCPKCGI